MIEILRKTSKLTIIMWTFLAQDYFIQMSIHKFSKHLLLWVSLVWSVSRLAWEASCLLISQMTTGRGWVLMRWPGRGCKTPATWRHSPRSGGSCSSTELLLKQDVYIFENFDFCELTGNICEKVIMERYSVGYACLRPSYYFDILFKIIPEFQKFMYDLSWKPWIDSSLDFQYMGSMVAVHLIFRSPDLENKFLSTLILRSMTHILMLGSGINNVNKF